MIADHTVVRPAQARLIQRWCASASWASSSSSSCWRPWSACAAPSFLSVDNFRDILLNISILLIVALAQTMVIITRGIDLSVSSMIGLVGHDGRRSTLVALPDLPMPLVLLLGMALGAVLGTFNGLIIAVGNVPPIIATLGTLSIYRGLVFFYSQGNWINAFEMPDGLQASWPRARRWACPT